MSRSLALLCAAGCVAAAGCSQGRVNAATTGTPVHEGPLTDYVPAAGLRWMAVGRPAELASAPALRTLLPDLVPKDRLDAFAFSTGIDLRETPSALAAGFDYSTLYLAETPFENRIVETRFVDRLVPGASFETSHPGIRRATGTIGLTPEALVRVDRRFVAFSVGDPAQAKIVELYALGRLTRSPTALRGSALRELPGDFDSAPVRFYAPGPFTDEWVRGARGLLGGATAFGAMAKPEGDVLRVRAVIAGSYSAADVAQLSSAWTDLAESSLGRLTGLDHPSSPPEVSFRDHCLNLDVNILLKPLFAGLRAAVAADVWELLAPGRGPEPNRPARDQHGS